ncbi:uncharacterized protein VP01_12171g1 [Puccinia sorghi]|uniref:Uncharacterized protein n=1 Tax=Puccinia sorghi TaxID=27349 RepID=A0A0L6VQ87_9BASI|nr:uncharacterized protein VP01_12171g1 [Puccinia sorghi]
MPQSFKRSECLRNLRKMLCLCVKQAAFKVQFDDSDNQSSSGTNSKKIFFGLDTGCFKQEFRMSHQSFDSLLSLIQNHPVFYSNSNVPTTSAQSADGYLTENGNLRKWFGNWDACPQFWILKYQLVLIKSINVYH